MTDTVKNVQTLIEKAASAGEPHHAMQYAQAALNAANAIVVLGLDRENPPPPPSDD